MSKIMFIYVSMIILGEWHKYAYSLETIVVISIIMTNSCSITHHINENEDAWAFNRYLATDRLKHFEDTKQLVMPKTTPQV